MQGEIVDMVIRLERMLSQDEISCTHIDDGLIYQIQDGELKLSEGQTSLAKSTKSELNAKEQSRLLVMSIATLTYEESQISKECDKNLGDVEMEICGIKQIRTELYKMSKMKKYIQDCVVSDWVPEECSASCEGGTQKIARTIQVPANMGMKCPPLEATRTCNDFTCPIDCVLEDWTGWSGCSAKCGGGVKQRVRGIGREAAHGGEPCGATSDSEACNTQSCDADCVLSDWSPWSNCSKACDVGTTVRVKDVTEEARGTGVCAEPDSETRLERKQCNTNECKAEKFVAKDGSLRCATMIDVMLLLDSSGSVGEKGWALTKKTAEAIISAFNVGDDGAQIAVLEFSGPDMGDAINKCMDGKVEDFEKECNIKWVSHLSTESSTLSSSVGGGAFLKGSSLTSAALAMAESELGNGRRDAKKLTMVITDGRPYSLEATKEAAMSLRKTSRLMFVPVTENAPTNEFLEMVTAPAFENLIPVKDFEELSSQKVTNHIISNACPNLQKFEEEEKTE